MTAILLLSLQLSLMHRRTSGWFFLSTLVQFDLPTYLSRNSVVALYNRNSLVTAFLAVLIAGEFVNGVAWEEIASRAVGLQGPCVIKNVNPVFLAVGYAHSGNLYRKRADLEPDYDQRHAFNHPSHHWDHHSDEVQHNARRYTDREPRDVGWVLCLSGTKW